MTKVMVNMSMSLDGFVAGPHVGMEFPMGQGGERLHDWMFERGAARRGAASSTSASGIDEQVTGEVYAMTGAVIIGKRTFSVGIDLWGDTPYPVPCFVLTHTPQAVRVEKSGTFTFVTDGIASALRQAQAAAGDRDINLMGADVVQQFLKAGLVDEIQINLVSVLLGNGLRLFEHFGIAPIDLESTRVLSSIDVTHLRYNVIK